MDHKEQKISRYYIVELIITVHVSQFVHVLNENCHQMVMYKDLVVGGTDWSCAHPERSLERYCEYLDNQPFWGHVQKFINDREYIITECRVRFVPIESLQCSPTRVDTRSFAEWEGRH